MQFSSITQIILWSGSRVCYLGNDDNAPYVWKGNLYHYFSLRDGVYTLFCTSERDLQEKPQ